MEKTLHMYEILRFSDFYTAIKDQPLPIKERYFMAKLNKRIEEERALYREQLQQILDKYAEKDEQGNFIPTENGGIKVIPETQAECQRAINELDSMEIKIEFEPIDLGCFDCSVTLTGAQIEAIIPFAAEI